MQGKSGNRYSKYLPDGLIERYNGFVEDPDLIALQDNIALVDTRISYLLENLDSAIPDASMTELDSMWKKFMRAVRDGEPGAQAAAVTDIDLYLKDGWKRNSVWNDIARFTDVRRKLSESEQKHIEANKHLLTIEQVMLLLQMIIMSVKEVAHLYADEETAQHIIDGTASAYAELVNRPRTHSDDGAIPVFERERKRLERKV